MVMFISGVSLLMIILRNIELRHMMAELDCVVKQQPGEEI
jgi:hypothetical protein